MLALLFGTTALLSQDVQAIQKDMGRLRSLDGDDKVKIIRVIVACTRALPDPGQRLTTIYSLSNLATEGDAGPGTLQSIADVMVEALDATRGKPESARIAPFAYDQLAVYAKHEGVKVATKAPEFQAAVKKLAEVDAVRRDATFELSDLTGKKWKLADLKGKVVVVNFWATWCPPCRKEMPDLEELSKEYAAKGLVVLAISDEKPEVVKKFIVEKGYSFPILLDPGRVVNTAYRIQGIPNSYVYGRDGKLVAQAMDGRTRNQFLKLLAKAGLR